jgi:hypothetical protein
VNVNGLSADIACIVFVPESIVDLATLEDFRASSANFDVGFD